MPKLVLYRFTCKLAEVKDMCPAVRLEDETHSALHPTGAAPPMPTLVNLTAPVAPTQGADIELRGKSASLANFWAMFRPTMQNG